MEQIDDRDKILEGIQKQIKLTEGTIKNIERRIKNDDGTFKPKIDHEWDFEQYEIHTKKLQQLRDKIGN